MTEHEEQVQAEEQSNVVFHRPSSTPSPADFELEKIEPHKDIDPYLLSGHNIVGDFFLGFLLNYCFAVISVLCSLYFGGGTAGLLAFVVLFGGTITFAVLHKRRYISYGLLALLPIPLLLYGMCFINIH